MFENSSPARSFLNDLIVTRVYRAEYKNLLAYLHSYVRNSKQDMHFFVSDTAVIRPAVRNVYSV